MSQKSALESLPSFSKTAFLQTNPQLEYKTVRRIQPKGSKNDRNALAAEECRSTLIKEPAFPDAKDIMLINGVDPDCKTSMFSVIEISCVLMVTTKSSGIKFKSTDFPLPFLYSGVPATPRIIPPNPQPGPKPANALDLSSNTIGARERKRDSDRRVEVELTVQPERKRPKREAERRAEALAKQGKR